MSCLALPSLAPPPRNPHIPQVPTTYPAGALLSASLPLPSGESLQTAFPKPPLTVLDEDAAPVQGEGACAVISNKCVGHGVQGRAWGKGACGLRVEGDVI